MTLARYKLGSSFFSKLALVVIFCPASLLRAENAEAAFQRAVSALSSQDYVSAESGFQSVLRMEPGNISALGNLGVVYSRTHRYNLAIDTYKRALRLIPGEKSLLTNLALAYVKQEQNAAAVPLLEKLAADPADLQAKELLATCYVSLAKYENALAVLQPLNVAEPGNTGVLYMLGITLSRLKRASEAREAFDNMMRSASPAQANFLMGKASFETARFPEAADFFHKAIEADPSLEGVHRELGKTLISLHEDDAAEKELRLAGPDDPEALYFLGGLLALTRPADAIAPLSKAKEMNPDFWGPMYYLGRIYAEQGRLKQALPLLEKAAALKPDESTVQYQLARALQKAGREAEAKAAFARVKELKSRSLENEVNALNPSK